MSNSETPDGFSRRSVLRGALYAVPAVTVVSLAVGSAEAASGGISGNAASNPQATNASSPSKLPFTGSPVVPMAALAAGTIAAGVGLEKAAAKRRGNEGPTEV